MSEFEQDNPSSLGGASAEDEETKETGRLEAFSDGVFAIAITLLVLEIQLPRGVAANNLAAAVLSQWPSLLAYVVSFLSILVMWLNHHSLAQFVRRADRLFFVYNGVLLMAITFVNYPTALVAQAATLSLNDQRFAAWMYSGTMVVIAALYNLLWVYASQGRRLIARNIPDQAVRAVTRQYIWGVPLYAISFLLAFASPLASLAVIFAMAVYFAFTGNIGNPARATRRATKRGARS
ncbi:MAG TPA: TMEM175 family protein [Ktedonobacterales bacterium]|nr:TMEM175 family protein [Ktedonobacterales bacterium]